jgi:cell division septation protein DedD
MSDEQFHEFHLDGKQMVFLFMASTVVAVVIFLCGVMVGRGVRETRDVPGALSVQQELSLLSDEAEEPPDLEPGQYSTDIPDDLRYSEVLQSPSSPVPDRIPATTTAQERSPERTSERTSASPPVVDEAPPSFEPEREPARKVDNPVKPKPETKASTQGLEAPVGPGWVVQVASLDKLSDAQAIRADLIGKGYKAFITETPTRPKRYRVRVGTFSTESKALAAKEQLEKVHNFRKPWTVRL